jgi:hypothetical protein
MKSAWPAMNHSKSLIPTCCPQEFNPHRAITATTLTRRNDDGLIVPVVPEYATPNCAARQAISDPPVLLCCIWYTQTSQSGQSLMTVDDKNNEL